MAGAGGGYIAAYCVALLVMLGIVAYGYWAWCGYRRAMQGALQRRHERDVELGGHIETDNYWRREDPHERPQELEAVPVALGSSPGDKATARLVYTAGVKTNL